MDSYISKTSEAQVIDESVSTTNESLAKFEKDSPGNLEASALDLDKKIGGSISKNIRPRRVKASSSGISEVDRLKALEYDSKEDFDNAVYKIHYKPKEPLMKRLYNSFLGQNSSRVANTEEDPNANCPDTTSKSLKLKPKKLSRKAMKRRALSNKCDISKIFQEEGYENKITFDQLLKWAEEKSAVIETLITDSAGTTDKIKAIESILEDVKKANRPIASKNETMSNLIKKLEENALRLLDIHKTAENCYGIKDLTILVMHLTATVGTKVTVDEVQKYINRTRVLNLHEVFQKQRKSFRHQIGTNKMYIEHGLKEVLLLRKEYKKQFKTIECIYLKDSSSLDMRGMNHKLKVAASESVEILNRYENTLEYLETKAKVSISLRKEIDILIFKFLTQETKDLFEAGA